ncbi:hypothetical protein [Psychrobacillus soli]|uniref:Uncharacterized protein n=1 Tax=Psychrobacillus soli TaxID=1543965 RepID=A0A544TFY4_9BACI|nr:hypothetical protein [Psychrobacillus soli]TQR16306.1 hypothetical protein FG383_07410 [Psychrobacillus soli]
MEDSKLYSTQDIENLKQKIAIYRDTLNSLKAGNSVEVKDEIENMQKEEYGERVKNITVQIESINQTVEVLSQDISVIMDLLKSEDVNDLIESINTLVDLHDSINISNENEENEIEKEINHTGTLTSPIPTATLPLSYKQFKDFFNNANDIQEITASPDPVVSIDLGDNQSNGRRSFPSIGVNTTQVSNSQFRNFHTKPTNTLNRVVMKQAIPLKVKINPSISFSLTPNDIRLEENPAVGESSNIVRNEAIVEETEDTVEMKVADAGEVIVEDAVEMEIEDTVEMKVADAPEVKIEDIVEMKVEDVVEIIVEDTDEMKVADAVEVIEDDTGEIVNEIVDESIVNEQPENKTKNRDFLSFFNFFLKKN